MRATLTGLAFAGALSSRLLSKCRRRSGRRSSHEAGCNRRFNSARGTVLRASHPARRHQVLPGIRRGAPRLPSLPSLVVVSQVLGLRASGNHGAAVTAIGAVLWRRQDGEADGGLAVELEFCEGTGVVRIAKEIPGALAEINRGLRRSENS